MRDDRFNMTIYMSYADFVSRLVRTVGTQRRWTMHMSRDIDAWLDTRDTIPWSF